MFDYFRKLKDRRYEDEANEQQTKPKNDKVFIGILIVFGIIIIVSLITGMGNIENSAGQNMNFGLRFSITDGVILGGLTLAYIIIRIRKGRK